MDDGTGANLVSHEYMNIDVSAPAPVIIHRIMPRSQIFTNFLKDFEGCVIYWVSEIVYQISKYVERVISRDKLFRWFLFFRTFLNVFIQALILTAKGDRNATCFAQF